MADSSVGGQINMSDDKIWRHDVLATLCLAVSSIVTTSKF